MNPSVDPQLRRARLAVLVLAGVAAASLSGLVFLLVREGQSDPFDQQTRGVLDEEARRAAVDELVQMASGIWDTFPDPEVGRVLQPGLVDRDFQGQAVSSNRYGLREDEYALSKPPGTVRVVLLGDSFIFGEGVEAEDRVGVALESQLRERTGLTSVPEIECLHFGLGSWNIRSEAAFLRRQLGLLKPDLVVHLLIRNDLDDNASARGFGSRADYSDQQRARANSMVFVQYPLWSLNGRLTSWLVHGLDHESRSRYAQCAQVLGDLAHAVGTTGGKYLAVSFWTGQQMVARERLFTELEGDQVVYLPTSMFRDEQYWASERNPHWNRAGAERVAQFLYGFIQPRDLLPSLDLGPWPEAVDLAGSLDSEGRGEKTSLAAILKQRPIQPAIDFARLTHDTSAQVHGGIDEKGFVGPYGSVILPTAGATRLQAQGRALPRLELEGATVAVEIDGEPASSIVLTPGQPWELDVALLPSVAERDFVTVSFAASDFVYAADNLRHCVAFRIRRIALVP